MNLRLKQLSGKYSDGLDLTWWLPPGLSTACRVRPPTNTQNPKHKTQNPKYPRVLRMQKWHLNTWNGVDRFCVFLRAYLSTIRVWIPKRACNLDHSHSRFKAQILVPGWLVLINLPTSKVSPGPNSRSKGCEPEPKQPKDCCSFSGCFLCRMRVSGGCFCKCFHS